MLVLPPRTELLLLFVSWRTLCSLLTLLVMLLLPPLWTSRRAWAGLVSLPLAHGSLLLFHITSVPTHKSAFPSLPHTHKSLCTSSRVTPLPAQGQLGQNRALYFLYPPPSPFLPFSIIFLISPPSLLPPFLPGQHCQHYLLFFCHLLLTYKLKRFSELSSLLYLTLYFSPTNSAGAILAPLPQSTSSVLHRFQMTMCLCLAKRGNPQQKKFCFIFEVVGWMELFAISRNTFLKYESPCCLEANAMLGGEFYWKNCSSFLQNGGDDALRLFQL